MTEHAIGDRVEFDTWDTGQPVRGTVVKVHRHVLGRHRGQVIEYAVRTEHGIQYVPPQCCYPATQEDTQ